MFYAGKKEIHKDNALNTQEALMIFQNMKNTVPLFSVKHSKF